MQSGCSFFVYRREEGADRQGIVSFRQLEKRVCDLEWRWQELNLIPTNSELFRRIRQLRGDAAGADASDAGEEQEKSDGEDLHKACQPVHEMWTQMQMMKQIEANTDGITKVNNSELLHASLPLLLCTQAGFFIIHCR
jgi:hypothetical protein